MSVEEPAGIRLVPVASSPAELDALLDGMMVTYYSEDHLEYDRARLLPAARALATDASLGRLWWIERSGGERAGYAALTFVHSLESFGKVAFVDELFVRPAARGCGVGTAALRELIRLCPGFGVRRLRLETTPGNARARALYLREGFRDLGRAALAIDIAGP